MTEKINDWTILYILKEKGSHNTKCICRCDCGRVFKRIYQRLKKNKCCYECARKKHGMSRTRLYYVWAQMKDRCYNPNNPQYKNYGGRGIGVTKEWSDSKAFLCWAKESGYKPGLTIDRINTNGNYEPTNCRWCNMHTQNANRRLLKRNRSGAAGVFKLAGKRSRPWQVDVGKYRVGYFSTYESAVEARREYITKNNLTEYFGSIFI